ncbi:arsenical resistance operon repressor [hydrocarbon metagenome]|uniref:Arsenical resistance operon repressor n=1 Tax=hydrocarbon metagenome TaxID=938273 RepID=A0A0W8FV15_9ZZZZ
MKEKTKLFKALSDPNRLRILKMLQSKHLCVCEITSVLNLATSTVSKHLSILRDSGFIIEEKDGKWVNFQINPTPSDKRVSAMLSSLDFWIADDKIITADREKVKNVDRYQVCSN